MNLITGTEYIELLDLMTWHDVQAVNSPYEEHAKFHRVTAMVLRHVEALLSANPSLIAAADPAPAKPSARARKRAH